METVAHHGRATAYRRPGAGEDGDEATVLYVHGSGGTHQVWAAQYGRQDGSRVALDLSGHGESDDVGTEPGTATLDAYADDVVAVARETGASVLVGNSLGGAVVQHVALERDLPLSGLVLADTGAKLGVADPLKGWLADDWDRAVEFVHGEDMLFHEPDPRDVERSKAMMRATGRAVTERDFLTCDRFDVRDRLGEVAVPVLAVYGEHDRLTPPEFHEYLAEHLPDAELVEIADAAHLPFVERPAAFDAAVSEFLAGR
jgi:pimeloyl-ACP methyl ester carboxylesterase